MGENEKSRTARNVYVSPKTRLGAVREVKKVAMEKADKYLRAFEVAQARGEIDKAAIAKGRELAWRACAWNLQQHEGNLDIQVLRKEQDRAAD